MVDIVIPLSVSGVWYPVPHQEPSKAGSLGIALVLEPYSHARVSEGEGVYINGAKVNFENLKYLEMKLGKVRVDMTSAVPLGYGYGMSASVSLAYSLGVAEIRGVPEEVAVRLAHESEVISGNGLGDVISQYYGHGIVCRMRPGLPPLGEVKVFESEGIVYSKPLAPLPTSRIVRRLDLALKLMEEFMRDPSLSSFFTISKRFAEALGFQSPYPCSFRKKGVILKLNEPESDSWIKHRIARRGAYVE